MSARKIAAPAVGGRRAAGPGRHRMVLTDVDVPFWRMVAIILKLMVASIPAAILFYVITLGVLLVCAMIFGGLATVLAGIGS